MMRILGIDPGSRQTGFGVIDVGPQRHVYIDCGVIAIEHLALPERLKQIHETLALHLRQHQPDHVAIEKIFMSKNAESALKLGQARGVAICAAALHGVPVYEYSAREVKQAVVGTGSAAKEQVQFMIRRLLGLSETPPMDAADALAIGLCHGHYWMTRQRLGLVPVA